MPSDWYYADGDKQKGPISQKELENLLTSGRLSPDTPVWNETLPDWRPANTIPALAAAMSPPAAKKSAAAKKPVAPAPAPLEPEEDLDEDWSDEDDDARGTKKKTARASRNRTSSAQSFGEACGQTKDQVFAALGQLFRQPLRLFFITFVFFVVWLLSTVSLLGWILIPTFVMGYMTCMRAAIDGEKMALEGFIRFMKHGWDSLWHLFMMLAAYFVTLGIFVAPFLMAYLVFNFTVVSVASVIGEIAVQTSSDSSSSSSRLTNDSRYSSHLGDESQFGAQSPNTGSGIFGMMAGMAFFLFMVVTGPATSAMILFFYFVLEVSRNAPDPADRFDLVYRAFGKMLEMGAARWKQLVLSSLTLPLIAAGAVGLAVLLIYLLGKMHLFVLAAGMISCAITIGTAVYVVFAIVFMTMTSLSFDDRKATP